MTERLIEFQIKGRLTPEKFMELANLLAQASLTDTVEIVEQSTPSQEIEDKYNTDYLQLIHLDESDEDVYLVTEDSFARFFEKNETDKNAGQVARAWQGLAHHYSWFHNKSLSDMRPGQKICNCPLAGITKTDRVAGTSCVQDWVVGVFPDSLVELSALLENDPAALRGLRVSPIAAGTIGLFVERLSKLRAEA